MTLLDLLKNRFEQAKKFTESKFTETAQKAIDDYDAKDLSLSELAQASNVSSVVNNRYEFVIPLIFTNTEAMKASLWDRLPDLIIKGRGSKDQGKKEKVEAAYEYIKDKLDLESFAFQASHWFILLGQAVAHGGFKSETYESPVYDPNTGEPMMNEDGTPQMQTLYSYNDPTIELGDPLKEYFSPESEYSIDARGIPFMFRKKLMPIEEIKKIYGVEVEADSVLNIEGYQKDDQNLSDIKRANVYFYYGTIPEESAKDADEETKKPIFPDWESGAEYYIIYTAKKPLYVEKKGERLCKIAKWYGNPNSFFGFGLGKIGRQFQKEKSIRRGQQIRFADVAAYPKIAVKNDGINQVDINKLIDPREQIVVPYESEAPQYLKPGEMSSIVVQTEQAADRDAQQAFGLMDIAQGAQNTSTVDTATGQTIFAEAAEKRVRLAKKNFMKFYQECIIMLLKEGQKHWDETKMVTITDENGQEKDIEFSKDDFADIDFDNDIEIDAESATVNKDVEREQMVALYDKTKDDPLVDRKVLFTDMIRMGFKVRNPERYIKQSTLQPGMELTDAMGNQYVVDESGEVVDASAMQDIAQPSGDPIASSQSGLVGANQ